MADRTSLASVDPQWAWAPFTPDAAHPFTRAHAAHLARRFGFAASSAQLEALARKSPQEAVEQLFAVDPSEAAFEREMEELSTSLIASGKPEGLSAAWLYRMLRTPRPLLEKLVLFWHGHFATSAEKVKDGRLMLDQYALLRRHAMGPFAPLAQDISKDPAMLIYLDSVTNRKAHPNENYARELMELFCLGLGAYTERDVQQLARCFTGWEVLRERFRFNEQQHDFGEKTILGRTAKFSGDEAVSLVTAQAAAPRFLVGKLFRFFVADEPAPGDKLLAPLVEEYQSSKLDTGRLLRRIAVSNLFFSEHARGRKIRSPVELGIGFLRALEGTTNMNRLAGDLAELGQSVFFPPSVKGWDGGRNWINSSTVLTSSNLVGRLARGGETKFAGGTLAQLAEKRGKIKGPDIVDWLCELLVAAAVSPAAKQTLLKVYESGSSRDDKIAGLAQAISLLPEFQLN